MRNEKKDCIIGEAPPGGGGKEGIGRMSVKTILAVGLCKGLHLAARVLHRGGTAMPGRRALKLCPDLPARLAKGVEILVITGTKARPPPPASRSRL